MKARTFIGCSLLLGLFVPTADLGATAHGDLTFTIEPGLPVVTGAAGVHEPSAGIVWGLMGLAIGGAYWWRRRFCSASRGLEVKRLIHSTVFLALAAGIVNVAPASLITIANSRGPFHNFGSRPRMNRDGTFAFRAVLDPGTNGGNGIYIADGITIGQIALDSTANASSSFTRVGDVAISDSAVVAFWGQVSGSNGIYLSTDVSTPVVSEASLGFNLGIGAPLDINNSQNLIFFAGTSNAPTTPHGIYSSFGPILLSSAADPSSPFSRLGGQRVLLNNAGFSAITAGDSTGGARELLVGNGIGSNVTLYDTSGPLERLLNPAINDSGLVVFQSELDGGGQGIFIGNGGSLTTIAVTQDADPTSEFSMVNIGFPWINASGEVAFEARTTTGDTALYRFSGGSIERVIGVGDSLAGSLIDNLDIVGLADSGEVGVFATLTDGTIGLYRGLFGDGSPPPPPPPPPTSTVPEPSAVIVWCLMGLTIGGVGNRNCAAHQSGVARRVVP